MCSQVPLGVQLCVGLLEWLLWQGAWAKAIAAGLAAGPLSSADHLMSFAICYLLPTAFVAWHDKLMLKQFPAARKPRVLLAGGPGIDGLGTVIGKKQGLAGLSSTGEDFNSASSSCDVSGCRNSAAVSDGDNEDPQSAAGNAGRVGTGLAAGTEQSAPLPVNSLQQRLLPLQQQQQQEQLVLDTQPSLRPDFVYTRPLQHLTHKKVAFKVRRGGADCPWMVAWS